MEFWWWLDPLFETALVCLAPAILLTIICVSNDVESITPVIICCVLSIPLVVAILCALVNFICIVFYNIWAPYI